MSFPAMEKICICCLILFTCSSVASNAKRDEKSEHSQTLEAQSEDEDNIVIELQGNYDKGRMHGEDADCGCKCVISALDKSAFPQRYTVHSVASGPGCKCACAAPTTAHKHLEDEKLNGLRKAARENRKLSAIFELLEDSVSSAEMLKLHTLITELFKRVENIERVLNKTNKKDKVESVSPTTEIKTTQSTSTSPSWQEKLKQQMAKSGEAAAYQHVENKYEERFVEVPLKSGTEDTVRALEEQERQEREQHPKMIVRGITYYKSDPVDEAETEENTADDENQSGDSVIDLFTEDELIPLGSPVFRPVSKTRQVTTTPMATTQVGTSEPENQSEQADSPLPVKMRMPEEPLITLAKPSQSATESIIKLKDLSPAPTDNLKTVMPTAHITAHSIPSNLTGTEHTKEMPTTQTMLKSDKAYNFSDITTDSNTTVSKITRNFKQTTVATVITQSESEFSGKTLTEQNYNTRTSSSKDIIQAFTSAQPPAATLTQSIQSTVMLKTSPTMVTDAASSMATTSKTISTTPAITNFETTESSGIQNTPSVTEHDTDFSTTTAMATASLITTTINSSKPTSTSYMAEEKEVQIEEDSKRKTIKAVNEENREQKWPGECMDTLATITEPIEHNTYGHYQGAWIKDPLAHEKKIYVANYFYGNDLLEFQNMDVFKQGRFTNSYKLPYSWLGTGHAVYDGAFFFNRAFSRDIIKYDLRRRRVAAWTMIHDAALESDEVTALDWTARSDVELAVDESGLWVIYAALDDEGFFQEVMVLSRLDPNDLSMQRETTWRTGLRRGRYGNCFIVCGVLYATDNYRERRERHLSYAFDTHTNTQMTPRLPFSNNATYIAQIYYNPKERALYVWDNGHQVTYGVVFAYVEPV